MGSWSFLMVRCVSHNICLLFTSALISARFWSLVLCWPLEVR